MKREMIKFKNLEEDLKDIDTVLIENSMLNVLYNRRIIFALQIYRYAFTFNFPTFKRRLSINLNSNKINDIKTITDIVVFCLTNLNKVQYDFYKTKKDN